MTDKPRLVVLTDIGGDPDDRQSMIRLMTYANEFDIEGLIASSTHPEGRPDTHHTRADLIRRIVEAYGQVQPSLRAHDPQYPEADKLLAVIRSGSVPRGLDGVGDSCDTEASELIIDVVDRGDSRPVNLTFWGGQADFAQALWRVRADRGAEGLKTFVARLRVYDIGDQDGIQPWIMEQFPGLFYILNKAPNGLDTRLGTYPGMYLEGDESLTSRDWIDRHVLLNHGPLGALYPTRTWTSPNPHATMKEGDTPSWFYFLPNGLSGPAHPGWGGWGGRFTRRAGDDTYRGAADTVDGVLSARATVWRWRDAYQRDFQARMDWCVKPPDQASHPPVVVLNGDESGEVVIVPAARRQEVKLSAASSRDPDGGELSFRWWMYPEAGTYPGRVELQDADKIEAQLTVPPDASGTNIHVIVEATSSGSPPLTRYRRAVVRVRKR